MVQVRKTIEDIVVGSGSGVRASEIVLDLHAVSDPAEEDRMRNFNKGPLWRYGALVRRACEVFGDDTRASLWLSTPSVDFGGQVPLKVAEEDGYSLERLEPVFIRLEHGIDF